MVRKLGHLSTLISHGPLCVSKRIKCFKDQHLKIYDNYNPFSSMGNTHKIVTTYVSTFRILNTVLVANKISSALQKLSKLLSLPKMLTSPLSANSYFTYFYSPNFLLFHSVPLHIHKPTEKTLTPGQIQLWHRFPKRKERESGSLVKFLLAPCLILIKPRRGHMIQSEEYIKFAFYFPTMEKKHSITCCNPDVITKITT